ncbi:glutamyl-tRNA reductase [Hymenobacter glacialis]|uniref:Glutamyl-tRNA reductase n=1 Tax=Hymenobacter glacialis TaxID=1908236 RepID=A0A1G1T426_9BACT|nr:glutamyl-tRNA reductase [Hymenobacter glacialis]OGX85631.1 glutamyl-tRNA reductase [Hymenobacter glacialis]
MIQYFNVLSLSHQQAPIAIREQLALTEPDCRALLLLLSQELKLADLLVLSTCNRTEVYYRATQDQSAAILVALANLKSLPDARRLAPYFVRLTATAAVQHLFKVAMGLDAQVVGDQQISHQVKQAYQWSVEADAAGPFLHRLLHTVFFTHKRVRQETGFCDGAASVSYAALQLVEDLTAHLPSPRVLLLGAGAFGADLARYFGASGRFAHVTVCNRTRARAEALAVECGLLVLDFADLTQGIREADVVISSVAAQTPLVTPELLGNQPLHSHKYFVDLSMPHSIAAAVETVPGVLLYPLEAIQSKASAALERRLAAVPQVRAIIAESMAGLLDWSEEMEVSPTIQKLKNALEQLRQGEMKRYGKKMSPAEAEMLNEITRSLMQKVLKQPVLQLKAACKRGEPGQLVDLLSELFDLERQPGEALTGEFFPTATSGRW